MVPNIEPRQKGVKYHAYTARSPWILTEASDEQLEQWGTDPDCLEMARCAEVLAERQTGRRKELHNNPFDPRTEVSADAKHIVKHLWILFMLVPFIFGALWVLVDMIASVVK